MRSAGSGGCSRGSADVIVRLCYAPMRFCLMLEGQEGVTWSEWVAAAQAAERLGFDAIFTSDHYFSVMGNRERGSSDAWTNLAGIAAVTSTIRLGTLVSPVTFRSPAVLAKCAVTVDRISHGTLFTMPSTSEEKRFWFAAALRAIERTAGMS